MTGCESLKFQASLTQWKNYELRLAFPYEIERKKQSRSLLRQFLYPARGRMNALQEIIERQLTIDGHDNFAIEGEDVFPNGQCTGNDFRKIAALPRPFTRPKIAGITFFSGTDPIVGNSPNSSRDQPNRYAS
jgi:hypothetical protein